MVVTEVSAYVTDEAVGDGMVVADPQVSLRGRLYLGLLSFSHFRRQLIIRRTLHTEIVVTLYDSFRHANPPARVARPFMQWLIIPSPMPVLRAASHDER